MHQVLVLDANRSRRSSDSCFREVVLVLSSVPTRGVTWERHFGDAWVGFVNSPGVKLTSRSSDESDLQRTTCSAVYSIAEGTKSRKTREMVDERS